LTRKNYFKWAQLVHKTLKDKGKSNHLTDDAPKEEDSRFTKWDEEDSDHGMAMELHGPRNH